ncbi:hypothetical protein [Micromonospora fulviviridis]|uniref:Uncharacterized protein n=1 Tax=Micromonospora fulviviridis TaxID=47860 RepID=A0ABV2VWK1_9ACTN
MRDVREGSVLPVVEDLDRLVALLGDSPPDEQADRAVEEQASTEWGAAAPGGLVRRVAGGSLTLRPSQIRT